MGVAIYNLKYPRMSPAIWALVVLAIAAVIYFAGVATDQWEADALWEIVETGIESVRRSSTTLYTCLRVNPDGSLTPSACIEGFAASVAYRDICDATPGDGRCSGFVGLPDDFELDPVSWKTQTPCSNGACSASAGVAALNQTITVLRKPANVSALRAIVGDRVFSAIRVSLEGSKQVVSLPIGLWDDPDLPDHAIEPTSRTFTLGVEVPWEYCVAILAAKEPSFKPYRLIEIVTSSFFAESELRVRFDAKVAEMRVHNEAYRAAGYPPFPPECVLEIASDGRVQWSDCLTSEAFYASGDRYTLYPEYSVLTDAMPCSECATTSVSSSYLNRTMRVLTRYGNRGYLESYRASTRALVQDPEGHVALRVEVDFADQNKSVIVDLSLGRDIEWDSALPRLALLSPRVRFVSTSASKFLSHDTLIANRDRAINERPVEIIFRMVQ